MENNLKKVFKNSSWIIFGQIFQMLLSFLVGAYTARYLQPENYGLINLGLSNVTIFSSISSLGIEGILINEMINNPNEEGTILGTSIVLRVISSILSIISLICFFAITGFNTPEMAMITIIQSFSLLFNVYEWIEYWFQSKLLSKYAVISRIVSAVVVALVRVIFIHFNLSVLYFAIVQIFNTFSCFILLYILFRKNSSLRLSFNKDYVKILSKKGFPFLLSSLCIILYARMDKIMIGYFLPEAYVGFYTAAVTLSELVNFIPQSIITSVRPVIFESAKEGSTKYKRRIVQLYCVVFYFCLLVGLCIFIFSDWIIDLVYGVEYIKASTSFKVLSFANIFSILGVARTILLVCQNRMTYLKNFTFLGSLTNLVLNIILIPMYGITGSAIATFITQFSVCIIFPLLYNETRGDVFLFLEALKFWKYLKIPKKRV